MKKVLLAIVLIATTSIVFAQNNIAKLKYEQAEEAFSKADYKTAVVNLDEAEKLLGSSNPKILYLKIISKYKALPEAAIMDLKDMADLKNDISLYLSKFKNAKDIEEKYIEVYKIGEAIAYYNISIQMMDDAKKGNDAAMLQIAETYYMLTNYTEAMKWYKKAAEKENAYALFRIGYLYDYGQGEKKDYTTAMEWYKKAAEKNMVLANHFIAYLYYNGQGVPEDKAKAKELFKSNHNALTEMAEKGDRVALKELASMYFEDIYLPRDNVKGVQLITKLANTGDAYGLLLLANIYASPLFDVTKDLPKAVGYYIKSADKGNTNAMLSMGGAYFNALGVEKNDAKAWEWIQKSADLGNTTAMELIGAFYLKGIIVKQDNKKAFEWYKKSADKGSTDAMVVIGNFYRDEDAGVARSYGTAREWYEKAITANDDVTALRQLGSLYYQFDGFGNKIDYSKAAEYFTRAAAKGEFWAMDTLGDMYESGTGVKKDKKMAKEWRIKAASARAKDVKY
jgi:TPR repeat protein